MPRRPAPTPLRLHPGPTPPRNHPKFTLPSLPQQSFYPTATPSVPVVKKELKYFRGRGHKRSSSSSSVSSTDSDDSSAGMAFEATLHRGEILAGSLSQLPPVMTKGPRVSNDSHGGMTMPQFKATSGSNIGVRSIQGMGPWEYSKLRLSEQEISAMVTPPQKAIANPCPAWLSDSQDNGTAVPPDGRSMSPPQTSDISSGGSPPLMNQQALNGSQQGGLDDDVIPTAIVIKNIPFNVKRETLLDIISSLAIPTPYAFNYHLDPAGQFRGLAFANFRVAADADAVVAALNGFDVQGRKLRVEYKKVLQAGEKERIEREKAIRRMRSMQLEKERQEQQQQQQMMMGGGGGPMGPGGYDEGYSPLGGPPGGRGSPFVNMAIQNPNPFAMPPMPVPQPYAHQAQSAPAPVQMQAPPPMPTVQQQQQQTAASVQKSSSAQTELDMNDAATLEIYSRILLFKDDHMRDELAFARSLSPKQRRIVHLVAQKLGVYHYSVGEGEERYAVVTRNQPDRSGGNSGGVGPTENGRRTPSAVENNNGHGRPEGRSGPVRHHSSQALNRSFLVSSTSANGGGSMFSTSASSYNPPINGSPTSTTPGGGLRAKKSMPDMKTSIYTPTPRLTTRTSSGNMREGGSTFSNYAALRRQTSGVLPGLGQIFGSHLTGNNNLARASVSGAIGDRPLAGLNGHPTEGIIPPVPSLPSTPEGGLSSSTSAAVMRQPRGPGAAGGGNFARRRESAIGPLDRGGSNSGLDARTHEPLEI